MQGKVLGGVVHAGTAVLVVVKPLIAGVHRHRFAIIMVCVTNKNWEVKRNNLGRD